MELEVLIESTELKNNGETYILRYDSNETKPQMLKEMMDYLNETFDKNKFIALPKSMVLTRCDEEYLLNVKKFIDKELQKFWWKNC